MFQADKQKGWRPKEGEVRRKVAGTVTGEQGLERKTGEQGRQGLVGPVGTLNFTEFKRSEKSQEGDEIWLMDQGPHPAARKSLKWSPLPSGYNQASRAGGQGLTFLFFPPTPVPPPSPAPGSFHYFLSGRRFPRHRS